METESSGMKNPEIQQQASLYVKRLPLRAVQRMLETHSEQKPERPPVVTMHRLKAIRDELKILVEGCDAIERVLDQSEAVLRFLRVSLENFKRRV